MLIEDRKKLKIILLLLFFLVLIGTLGYMLLLKTSLINALYMTVITISTVGYKEVGVMSQGAKIFSIFLIFFGVGTVAYTFSTVLVMFIEGKIQDIGASIRSSTSSRGRTTQALQKNSQKSALTRQSRSTRTAVREWLA